MQTLYTSSLTPADRPQHGCVATIGFFDGVHRGHQFLIAQVKRLAVELGLPAMVITFDEHPRRVLHADYQPQLLSTLDEKLLLLSRTGIDTTAVLHFTPEMAAMSARQFMGEVLAGQLGVSHLVIGYDHRFGHNRSEGFDDYVRYGRELGISVVLAEGLMDSGVGVSSSMVRSLLADGEVALAERCLGRPYTLVGRVERGYQEGRKIGFPTANLHLGTFCKMVPAPGVYAVRVRIEGSMEMKRAMMNIGHRPTYGGTHTTLEVHLLQYSGNLYGQMMLVAFVQKIRDEQRFASPEALAVQLASDAEAAERLLGEGQ